MSPPTLQLSQIGWLGAGLDRPECVLALASGDLFVSRRAAGVEHIRPDRTQRVIGTGATVGGHELVPNGIALLPDNSFLIANIGEAGGIWRLTMAGEIMPWLMEVGGEPLGAANFVMNDAKGRIWITVSTRQQPRYRAYSPEVADGFVALVDQEGARIVADGMAFTNECRLSPGGDHLYVSATFARAIYRYELQDEGTLGPASVFAKFGYGDFPDGIAFDEEGHLWVASIVSNRVYRIAPSGEKTLVVEDMDAGHVDEVEQSIIESKMQREHFYKMRSEKLKNVASIAFAGPDRRTVLMGSLLGDKLATFEAPAAGVKPVHWDQKILSDTVS